MIAQETGEVRRKIVAILKILKDSPEPVGSRAIARQLKNDHGVNLTERAVRYHLKLMDEKGLTHCMGKQYGRLITQKGLNELKNALPGDKIYLTSAKIEHLTCNTSFDLERGTGKIPIDVALFPKERWDEALRMMKSTFDAGICFSKLVVIAIEGYHLGEVTVPQGSVGIGTVCSIAFNGILLKAGIPMDPKFGGVLQIRNHKPLRFVELVEYTGSSLAPTEIFIANGTTCVTDASKQGDGKVIASFGEIPALSRAVVERIVKKLKSIGLGGVVVMGETGRAVCEIPVGVGKVGIVLLCGLNPVAAAAEAGIKGDTRAMSGLIDFKALRHFNNIYAASIDNS